MLDAEALAAMLAPIIAEEVEKAMAPLNARIAELENRPAPEKGEKGEPGEPGKDGAAPTLESIVGEIRPQAEDIIRETVARAVAELPAPEPGERGETGEPGEKGEPGNDGADGRDGRDGRGVKELLIDRNGHLVATMDDGEMKNLGPVIGKDGEPGKDGKDGFGFDDMDVCVLDDDRTIELSFRRGDDEKAFTLKWPTVIYRGVWREGDYAAGDSVTWGGSLWIAEKDTGAKPDTSDSGWRLAVKKGRDGKNG